MFHKTNAICPNCGETICVVDNRHNTLYCRNCGVHFSDKSRDEYKRCDDDRYFTVYINTAYGMFTHYHGTLVDIACEFNASLCDYSKEKSAIKVGWRRGFPQSTSLYKCIMLMDNKVNKFEGVTTIKLRELINKFAFNRGDDVQIFDEMGKLFETISISQLEIYSWTFDEYMDRFVNKFWFNDNRLCVQIS